MSRTGIETNSRIQNGYCGRHGLVRATKRLPGPYLPLSVYTIHRALAESRPCRCPVCGTRLTAISTEKDQESSTEEENEWRW